MKAILTSFCVLLPLCGWCQCFQFGSSPTNPWAFNSTQQEVKQWINSHYSYLSPNPTPTKWQEGLGENAKPATREQQEYLLPSGQGMITFLFKNNRLRTIMVRRKQLGGSTPWSTFTPCGKEEGPGLWVDTNSRAKISWTPTQLTYVVREQL